MRIRIWLALMCLIGLVTPSISTAAEPDRLREATDVVKALRAVPEGVSEDVWNKAECVAVIPSMKKAAFVIGGEYGRGVMSCRNANGWSAPVFLQLAKGSWGLQIGAEAVDLVLLVMNRQGVDKLLDNKLTLGADASIAAGPVGRTGAAATDVRLNAQILSYSRAKGLFAGIDLSGGVLQPDKDANRDFYGRPMPARDILFGNVVAPTQSAAQDFVNALGRSVRATTGQR